MAKVELKVTNRNIFSFCPMLIVLLPFIYVYATKALGLDYLCSRGSNEIIAMPLVFVSVASFGILVLRKHNEFALIMLLLSVGFFCREWHFAGTSNGIYVVLAIVAGWFVVRRKSIDKLIKGNKVEIWLWATFLCYVAAQLVARRVFSDKYLGFLPREDEYHIFFEETIETTAHLMLMLTSFVSWNQFGSATKANK